MIEIDVQNAQKLARRESLLARTLGNLTPKLLQRKVEERIADQLRDALREHGVEATIRVV